MYTQLDYTSQTKQILSYEMTYPLSIIDNLFLTQVKIG